MMNLTMGLRKLARFASRDAILTSGDVRLSSGQFVDRVARLASVLRSLGMQDDDRVAMLAANSHCYIEYYFAALWGGGVTVPINSRFSLPEMIEQVRDASPVILIVDKAFLEYGERIIESMPSIRALIYVGDGPAPANAIGYEEALASAQPLEDRMRGADDLACLYYTGGTSGRAKGVMLSHGNLWANAMATGPLFGFGEETVCLHAGPLFHLGAGARVYTTAVFGGRHVVLPRFSPAEVLSAIGRERITTASFVPTMLTMLLEVPNFDSFDLLSLRVITYGASPMPEALLAECLRRFPGIRFAQSYGMTELSPAVTVLMPEDHLPQAPRNRLRSAGRPIVSVEVKVVDGNDEELPCGQTGEIVVRGPNVMQGYRNQPELTAQVLRGGWMHTGDAGHFDADGYLYVVDRIKDFIISGGENVYSIEVEDAIYSHPAVLQCAVIGIPDRRWGEAVHAVIVQRPGAQVTEAEIIDHCRKLIAGYKCPRSVEIRSEAFPLSGANKINKAELRKPFWKENTRQVN